MLCISVLGHAAEIKGSYVCAWGFLVASVEKLKDTGDISCKNVFYLT